MACEAAAVVGGEARGAGGVSVHERPRVVMKEETEPS